MRVHGCQKIASIPCKTSISAHKQVANEGENRSNVIRFTSAYYRMIYALSKCHSVMIPFADRIDWERWEEAWTNGCQNLFTTLRRIKRFLHTLRFHIQLFANDDVLEVDPVDLFLVEVLRKFAPLAYEELPRTLSNAIYISRRSQILFFLKESEQTEFGQPELNALLNAAPEEI